jgi:hypothetical protein
MNLNIRFVLITTMAVVIFGAIALVPQFTRIVHKVHATPTANDVVLLSCDRDGSKIEVLLVDSSNLTVTLPAIGSDCAAGLALIQSQGFVTPPMQPMQHIPPQMP